MKIRKYFRAIISISMVLILCVTYLPNTVCAQASENDVEYVNIYDAELEREIQIGIKSSDVQSYTNQKVYNYEVYLNGQLDYRIQVDLENDIATLYYSDGKVESWKVSDTVTVTKIDEPNISILDVEENEIVPYGVDYVDDETFVLSEAGAQVNLGTNKYDGYEAMGSRTFANPMESGYLQRKASGCTDTFHAYRFTLEAGCPFGAAVSIIASLIKEGGGAIAEAVVIALLSYVVDVVGNSIVKAVTNGKIECREYRWDYRVRHNSNTGTILLSEYKYRYFWVMTNDGKSAYELRSDLRDGWVLSNAELIAHALGRS